MFSNTVKLLKLKNRIALLESRGIENVRLANKARRKLRKLSNSISA